MVTDACPRIPLTSRIGLPASTNHEAQVKRKSCIVSPVIPTLLHALLKAVFTSAIRLPISNGHSQAQCVIPFKRFVGAFPVSAVYLLNDKPQFDSQGK